MAFTYHVVSCIQQALSYVRTNESCAASDANTNAISRWKGEIGHPFSSCEAVVRKGEGLLTFEGAQAIIVLSSYRDTKGITHANFFISVTLWIKPTCYNYILSLSKGISNARAPLLLAHSVYTDFTSR